MTRRGRSTISLAGGDILRRVEGEARRGRQAPELVPAVRALERVRRVLDHGEAELEQRLERKNLRSALVTTNEGRLVGVIRRAAVFRA